VKIFNKISYIPEFKKDLKRLGKRFKTLEDEDKVELIEIYYKQDKEKKDRERILRYYEKC